MDVVSFKFESLPKGSRYIIRLEGNAYNARGQLGTSVEHWFYKNYRNVDIIPIYDYPPRSYIIVDYEIRMPRDQYVEFCLKWM